MSDSITWSNERRKLRDLIPWEHNPREINKREAERLGESLETFGQIQTIAIGPDNEVYDGHQRRYVWAALPRFGPDYEVDVRVSSRTLTEKERQKLVVFLHRGTTGQWDWDKLADSFEVPELLEWGFDESELQLDWGDDEKPDDPGAQIDKADELRQKWGVELGQLWQLGEHRLICGDCTDADVVARVMGGNIAGAIATDPPYAFGLSSTSQMAGKSGGWHDMMNNSSWFVDRLRQWRDVSPNGLWWMFCNWRTLPIVMRAAFDAKEGIESVMVWHKDWIGPGGSKGLRPAYEMIALFANGNAAIADRGQPDVVTVQWSSHKPTGHKAEKPVELFDLLIGLTSGDVFEPFCGSGTGIISCERLHRKCRAIEISPAYCAVTIQRWVDMTGGEPILLT